MQKNSQNQVNDLKEKIKDLEVSLYTGLIFCFLLFCFLDKIYAAIWFIVNLIKYAIYLYYKRKLKILEDANI